MLSTQVILPTKFLLCIKTTFVKFINFCQFGFTTFVQPKPFLNYDNIGLILETAIREAKTTFLAVC